MKRLLLAVLSLVPLLHAAAAPAAACPDPLPQSTLRQLDPEEELSSYVLLRWLACGAEAALPLLPLLRERMREQELALAADEADAVEYTGRSPHADTAGTFERTVILALSMNPAGIVATIADDEIPAASDPDATALEHEAQKYLPLLRDRRQMLHHYEQGVQAGIAFLRRNALSPPQEQLVELALVAQEIRQGRLDAARQRLARIAAASPGSAADDSDDGSEEEELLRERLQDLAAVLAPVQAISLAPDAQPWVLDRSSGSMKRFRCGTAAMFEAMFGSAHLREIVLRRADPDAAIAERLREAWKSLIESPRADSDPLLQELLRKRYTPAELRTGLDDAIASIRGNDGRAQLMLFGQSLALPGLVLEGDASVTGGTRTRELSVPELAELVRAGDLYRRFGAAAAATASAPDEG